MEIVIKRAFYVNVIIDDKEPIKIKTNYDTVGKIISDLRKEHGTEYILESGSSSSKPEPNMQIKLIPLKRFPKQKKKIFLLRRLLLKTTNLRLARKEFLLRV